ncbi:hypothetical protein D1007_20466 [Hordeum vulgare]|nr:hypothetical protein D1007_20466 [Hordeum vulgare]
MSHSTSRHSQSMPSPFASRCTELLHRRNTMMDSSETPPVRPCAVGVRRSKGAFPPCPAPPGRRRCSAPPPFDHPRRATPARLLPCRRRPPEPPPHPRRPPSTRAYRC